MNTVRTLRISDPSGSVRKSRIMLDKIKVEIELLGRHIEVLDAVVEHQPIGIIKLSELLSLPFHRIRYSLRVLEQYGYIRASPTGAVATPDAWETPFSSR